MKVIAIALMLLLHTSVAYSEGLPSYGKGFHGTLPGEPSMELKDVRRPENLVLLNCLGDTLYKEHGGTVEPSLARDSIQYSPDGLQALVKLNKHVIDDEGRRLEPRQVALFLNRIRKDAGNPLNVVKNIFWDNVSNRIVFKFLWPLDDLEKRLSMPETALRGGNSNLLRVGPFQDKSEKTRANKSRGALVLENFEGHHRGTPFLDQILLDWTSEPAHEVERFQNGYTQMSRFGPQMHGGGNVKYKYRDLIGSHPSTLFLRIKSDVSKDEKHIILKSLGSLIDEKELESSGGYGDFTKARVFSRVKGIKARFRKTLGRKHRQVKRPKEDLLRALKGKNMVFIYRRSKPLHGRLLSKITFMLHQKGFASSVKISEQPHRVALKDAVEIEMDEWVFDSSTLELLLRQFFSAQQHESNGSTFNTRPLSVGVLRSMYMKRLPILPVTDFTPRIYLRTDALGLSSQCFNCFSKIYYFKRPRLH